MGRQGGERETGCKTRAQDEEEKAIVGSFSPSVHRHKQKKYQKVEKKSGSVDVCVDVWRDVIAFLPVRLLHVCYVKMGSEKKGERKNYTYTTHTQSVGYKI